MNSTALSSHTPVRAEREELSLVQLPRATTTWQPIPHTEILTAVETHLAEKRIDIVGHNYTLSHAGQRFFGILKVKNASAPEGCLPTVGLRNSSDKYCAAGIAAGLFVLCCSNGSFTSDEIALSRRHTINILHDLPELVRLAVQRLEAMWAHQVQQVEAYRGTRLTDVRAHDLVIKAMDAGAFSSSKIQDVLGEWRNPSHSEFEPRTVWSFFNASTEILKEANPFGLAARTRALHQVCDEVAGIN